MCIKKCLLIVILFIFNFQTVLAEKPNLEKFKADFNEAFPDFNFKIASELHILNNFVVCLITYALNQSENFKNCDDKNSYCVFCLETFGFTYVRVKNGTFCIISPKKLGEIFSKKGGFLLIANNIENESFPNMIMELFLIETPCPNLTNKSFRAFPTKLSDERIPFVPAEFISFAVEVSPENSKSFLPKPELQVNTGTELNDLEIFKADFNTHFPLMNKPDISQEMFVKNLIEYFFEKITFFRKDDFEVLSYANCITTFGFAYIETEVGKFCIICPEIFAKILANRGYSVIANDLLEHFNPKSERKIPEILNFIKKCFHLGEVPFRDFSKENAWQAMVTNLIDDRMPYVSSNLIYFTNLLSISKPPRKKIVFKGPPRSEVANDETVVASFGENKNIKFNKYTFKEIGSKKDYLLAVKKNLMFEGLEKGLENPIQENENILSNLLNAPNNQFVYKDTGKRETTIFSMEPKKPHHLYTSVDIEQPSSSKLIEPLFDVWLKDGVLPSALHWGCPSCGSEVIPLKKNKICNQQYMCKNDDCKRKCSGYPYIHFYKNEVTFNCPVCEGKHPIPSSISQPIHCKDEEKSDKTKKFYLRKMDREQPLVLDFGCPLNSSSENIKNSVGPEYGEKIRCEICRRQHLLLAKVYPIDGKFVCPFCLCERPFDKLGKPFNRGGVNIGVRAVKCKVCGSKCYFCKNDVIDEESKINKNPNTHSVNSNEDSTIQSSNVPDTTDITTMSDGNTDENLDAVQFLAVLNEKNPSINKEESSVFFDDEIDSLIPSSNSLDFYNWNIGGE